jgi:hypothetical protein
LTLTDPSSPPRRRPTTLVTTAAMRPGPLSKPARRTCRSAATKESTQVMAMTTAPLLCVTEHARRFESTCLSADQARTITSRKRTADRLNDFWHAVRTLFRRGSLRSVHGLHYLPPSSNGGAMALPARGGGRVGAWPPRTHRRRHQRGPGRCPRRPRQRQRAPQRRHRGRHPRRPRTLLSDPGRSITRSPSCWVSPPAPSTTASRTSGTGGPFVLSSNRSALGHRRLGEQNGALCVRQGGSASWAARWRAWCTSSTRSDGIRSAAEDQGGAAADASIG